MEYRERSRNVFLYRLYVIFNEPLFWGPILTISLQRLAGMSLPEIYYMEAVVLCLCVALDAPSGAIADVIGRRRTIILGRIFLAGSIVCFALMTNALWAWIGNLLWAVGFTLQSGADTSLLYETLKEDGRESEYKTVQGQAVGTRFVLMAFTSLAVGFLAETDPRLPLYFCIPFVLVPLVAAFLWKEPILTERYSVGKQMECLRQGIAFAFKSVQVRWMLGFAALILSTSKVWFFTYNPYFELVGVPLAHFGFIFFLLNIVAFLSSYYADRIESRLGERRCVLVAVLCVGGPIVLMALVPIHPFAYLVVVQNIVRGFMRPFLEDYIHHHITASDSTVSIRATVMSLQTTVANLTAIVGLAGFGFLTGHLTLLTSLGILGFLCLALGGWSYWSYVRRIA